MKRLRAHRLLLLLALAAPALLHAECKLSSIATLPVTMEGLRPIVSAQVNGFEARFVADSGAFYSLITPAAATEFRLPLRAAPYGMFLIGVGGKAALSVTKVKDFTLAHNQLHNVDFVVGGTDTQGNTVGVLGQNLFRIADVEYALADGAIRLIKADGCNDRALAFWAPGKPYSEMRIDPTRPAAPHTVGTAYVNGRPVRAMFDTGASTSVLSLAAAERAGVKPSSPGVISAGYAIGFGGSVVRNWIAPFASFKIGDEEILNTRLRIGDTGSPQTDMLIGADFFLSHHIYVASSQRKLYFTYNGGPVFNLTPNAHPTSDQRESAAEAMEPAADSAAEAERLAQQGRIETARGELDKAITDLRRAAELKPDAPAYQFELGQAHLANKQSAEALADFQKSVELDPGNVAARMRLAELHRAANRNDDVVAQLDALDHLIPKESDLRLELGALYDSVDRYAPAIAQYDLWISVHKVDARMPGALNGRCWARARWGRELDKALDDCDAALRLRPKSATILDSRALVRLRQGKLGRAISDYDAALKGNPKSAMSLYGRGLAKLRDGKKPEGDIDLSAAKAIAPEVADEFAKMGLTP